MLSSVRTGGQSAETGHEPGVSFSEAKLVLGDGEPRLWIMHLPNVGVGFTRIARHRRVRNVLGALGGKEWLIGAAPPGDLGDDARLPVEDIAAFRVPGDRLIQAARRDLARRAAFRPRRMPIREPRKPRHQPA